MSAAAGAGRGPGPADAYIRYYETLTPEGLSRLAEVVASDVRFKDPFNDVRGIDAYRALLARMFRDVPDIRFKVTRQAVDGATCYIRWTCDGTVRAMGAQPWHVEGMSELRFSPDGKVREHIDFWDAAEQFYERLPLIGGLLRFIRRRFLTHR